jgi:DNA-binding NtrC family response regulator
VHVCIIVMNDKSEIKLGILVVDDEQDVRVVLEKALSQLTDDVVVVESGEDAIQACLSRSFDLVISDMSMPGMDGAELLHSLAKDYPSMRRIILTGYSDLDQILKSINQGRVNRYLTKPFAIDALLKEVRDELLLGERERAEVTRLREAIDRLSDD